MGYTIDIDTGGTFTDGLFTDGKEIRKVKVDSTPHDLTVSWSKCMVEGAKLFDFPDLDHFMEQVEIIRWSNTFASNVVAERKGPKLGIFVTDGYQDNLYYEKGENPVFGHLVAKEDVIGISYPFKREELLFQVKELLEKGVRRVCVSMKDGLRKTEEEDSFKEIFEGQYPDHYLGNVPLLSAKELCKHPDDMTRTHYALLNAYVHGPMAMAMFKAEDMLKDQGYKKPLLLGQIDGGVARVAKTKPVATIESGPIFGLHAAKYWAKVYETQNVIAFDVGGTTSKFGTIAEGHLGVTSNPDIFGIPLKQQMPDLRSIALGGGTIAKIDGDVLSLGPESMGAYPGPACYGLGGTEATLTDAFLIKGLFDPNYFAGGTKAIDVERAEKALSEKIATPLGISVTLAAEKIVDLATDMLSTEIKNMISIAGKSASEFSLFGYGGNGALLSCEVAAKAGIETVNMFNLGSVFSCFGSSVADISHTYEYASYQKSSEENSLINQLQSMAEEAVRDMTGEGFATQKVDFTLEMTVKDSEEDHDDKAYKLIEVGKLSDFSAEQTLNQCLSDTKDSCFVEMLKLQVVTPALKVQTEKSSLPDDGTDLSFSLKGERNITTNGKVTSTDVYQWEKLNVGNEISGNAIIESIDTNYFIPENWDLKLDSYGNAIASYQNDSGTATTDRR